MKNNRDFIDTLEKRQLLAATITSTSLGNVSKQNANDIIVKFSAPATGTPDITKISVFGYGIDTLNGNTATKKIKIRVRSASVVNGDLVIRTKLLVAKNSRVILSAGAVKDNTNADIVGTAKTTKGLSAERFTLAARAFKVSDKSYFSNVRLADGATPIVASTAASESAVLSQLTSFLGAKVTAGTITQAQKDAALANYNSATNKAIIPAHNLRAAVCSLVGTVGEPAINFYFNKANSTGKAPSIVTFDSAQLGSQSAICEGIYTSTGRYKLIWNSNYAGESFAVLSGRMAHEAMHDSSGTPTNSQDEEVIVNFVESTIYAQQIAADPTLAQSDNTYVLYANYRLFVLLNSGSRQFPGVGALKALTSGGIANPGFAFSSPYVGTNIESFDSDVREEFKARNVADKPPTEVNDISREILAKLTGNTYTSTTGKFSDTVINDIDGGQDIFTDAFALRIASVLKVSV